MPVPLPEKIGAEVTIPRRSDADRREFEGRGFVVVAVTPQTYRIRRDYPDGALKRKP